MRCVRRHIREAEAFLAAEQAMSLANMHYATSNSSSSSCSSSNSSVSSISSSSSTNGLDSLNNVNGGVKRLYFLDEPIHDDFDFALLSPIAYDAPPSSSFKAYVLEPCSSL
jgi:hypothetical protein